MSRDRQGTFEPQIVPQHETHFSGCDAKILSLSARGVTPREITRDLQEIYGVEVSPALISSVTDAVMDEVTAWQTRPLEEIDPILYLDALRVKMRDGAHIRNKAIYRVIGVRPDGTNEARDKPQFSSAWSIWCDKVWPLSVGKSAPRWLRI